MYRGCVMKRCRKCGIDKHEENDFFLIKRKTGEYRDTRCKDCVNAEQKAWQNSFVETHGMTHRTLLRSKSLAGYFQSIIRSIRARSKQKGFDNVDLTAEYLVELYEKQQRKCALTGWKMTTTVGQGNVFSNVSVDRVESSKGYTKNNIQLVCRAANGFKNSLTTKQFVSLCKSVCKLHGYIIIK